MSLSFKPGDYIKPSPNSRFAPEHWRYVVVQVGSKGMHVLDPNNNITLVDYPPFDDFDFELAQDADPETLQECIDASHGLLDHRFDHWSPLE